jgi:hypothetical protein
MTTVIPRIRLLHGVQHAQVIGLGCALESLSPILLRGGGRAIQFGAARKSTQPETDATRMGREWNALDRLDVHHPGRSLSCESAEPA